MFICSALLGTRLRIVAPNTAEVGWAAKGEVGLTSGLGSRISGCVVVLARSLFMITTFLLAFFLGFGSSVVGVGTAWKQFMFNDDWCFDSTGIEGLKYLTSGVISLIQMSTTLEDNSNFFYR